MIIPSRPGTMIGIPSFSGLSIVAPRAPDAGCGHAEPLVPPMTIEQILHPRSSPLPRPRPRPRCGNGLPHALPGGGPLVLPRLRSRGAGAASALTHDEQLTMLDAARNAGPAGRRRRQRLRLPDAVRTRQGALAFLSVRWDRLRHRSSPGARPPPSPLAGRHVPPVALVNANHAGIPFLGHHPLVSRMGSIVGIVFTLFWAV